MGTFVRGIATAATAVVLVAAGSATAGAQELRGQPPAPCPTSPTYDPGVPTPQSVLGFPLGIGQTDPVTSEQIVRYVQAVDAGVGPGHLLRRGLHLGRAAAQGRDRVLARAHAPGRAAPHPRALRRAARGPRRARRRPARLARDRLGRRQRPRRREERRRRRAQDPVRAGRAALSCDVGKRNDNLVTIIVPTQNPDGRDATRRQNEYGFDLNRDWFARTQPETDGKLEMLRQYPPQVFVDAHEMGGRQVLLPAERRPDPPRDRRRAGRLDQPASARPTRRLRLQRRLHRAVTDGVLLQLRRLRPVLHGLRRHGAGHRLRRGRHDVREGQRLGGRGPGAAAVQHAVGDHRLGLRTTSSEVLNGYYKIWQDALAEGGRARSSPTRSSSRPTRSSSRFRTSRSGRTSCCPTAQLGDVAQAGRAAAADGRRGLRAEGAGHGAATPRSSAVAARPEPEGAGGRLLDPDGPAAEALDPGDSSGEDPYVPFPYFYDVSSWSNPLLMGVRHRLHR